MTEKQVLKSSIDDWHRYMCLARDGSIAWKTLPLPSVDIAVALVSVRRSGKTYKAIQIGLGEMAPEDYRSEVV